MIVRGKCQWAKIHPHQLDRTYVTDERTGEEKVTGGVWTIDLIVDKDNESVINEAGLGHLVNFKNGIRYIKFKRNEFQKDQQTKKRSKANTPPKVVDKDKKVIPTEKEVGNGSTVIVAFTTYTGFKSKKYATLQAVQVLEHVVFERGKAKGDSDPLWELDSYGSSNDDSDSEDEDTPPFDLDDEAENV